MSKMQSILRWCLVSVLLVLPISGICAGTAENEASRLEQLRHIYDYENWPGKDGPVRDGFRLDSESLPAIFRLSCSGVPNPFLDKQTGHLGVNTRYTVTRADGGGRIFVDVVVCETPVDAHVHLFTSVTATSMPQPPLMSRGSEIDLNLGDVCFGSRGRDGYTGSIAWARNNIFANVRASTEDMRSDVEELARTVDAAVSRRATCPTYLRCPSRPVITKVARVENPEDQSRLGLKTAFKVVEVKLAPGEKLYHYSSNDLFKPGWPGEFPFVVSDSNLIGFPESGIARWKTNGPNPDQVNAETDVFLRKWEPSVK